MGDGFGSGGFGSGGYGEDSGGFGGRSGGFGNDGDDFSRGGYESRGRGSRGGRRGSGGGYAGNQRSRGGSYERNFGGSGGFGADPDSDSGRGGDSRSRDSSAFGGGNGFGKSDDFENDRDSDFHRGRSGGGGFKRNDNFEPEGDRGRYGDDFGRSRGFGDSYRDSDGGFGGRGQRGRPYGRSYGDTRNKDNGNDRFNDEGNDDFYSRGRGRGRPFSQYGDDREDRRGGSRDGFGRSRDDMGGGRGRGYRYDNRDNDDRDSGFGGRKDDGYGGGRGGRGGYRTRDDYGGDGYRSRDDFGSSGFGSGGDSRDGSSGNDWRRNDRNDDRTFRNSNRNYEDSGRRYDDNYGGSRGGRGTRGRGSFDDGGFGNRERERGDDNSGNRDTSAGGPPKPPVNYVPSEVTDAEMEMHIRAGVNFENQLNAHVETAGENCPEPIQAFEEAGFHGHVMDHLQKSEISVPTVVQRYGIPVVMAGRDYMACAQTGSGKTATFLLPILDSILKENKEASSRRCTALVLVPTRELAVQINTVAMSFLRQTQYRSVVIYGGVSVMYQSQSIGKGCDILVGTPGRLCDFIRRGYVQLSSCRYFVVDEADRLLDMGFERDFRFIAEQLRSIEHQTMMFSATFPPAIQAMAKEFLKPDFIFQVVGRLGGANKDISQEFLLVNASDKQKKLEDIVGERIESNPKAKILVFVGRKRVADFVAANLAHTGLRTTSIHGDREQEQRETALRSFKNGSANVLIATEVAARGLDIVGVDLVVNYDLPASIDDYVHRIGRTGRVGNPGKAMSFYDQHTDAALANELVEALRLAEQDVPSFLTNPSAGADGDDYGNSFDNGDYGTDRMNEREKVEETNQTEELEDIGW